MRPVQTMATTTAQHAIGNQAKIHSIETGDGAKRSEDEQEGAKKQLEDFRRAGYLPTSDVCRLTQYSTSGLFRAARILGIKGTKPIVGRGAMTWFSQAEIDRILRAKQDWKRENEERGRKVHVGVKTAIVDLETQEHTKAAFLAFKSGKSAVDLVIETGMPPTIVEHLWKKWLVITGGATLSADDMKFFRNFPWAGVSDVETVRDLRVAIRHEFALKSRESKCLKCGQRPKKICEHCFKAAIDKVQAAYIGLKPLGG
jgi:hypothetical protein